jgi:hypothetical protein
MEASPAQTSSLESKLPECIYCRNSPDSSEHWLPRSIGTFGPLQVLNGKICGHCNEALGREIDPEFTRVGPEAILRSGLGIDGRHGPSKSPFYFRAATEQPLRAVVPEAPEDEAGLLWETVPGTGGEPEGRLLQQLVILDDAGKRHAIPFNIEWPADVLRKAIKHRGIAGGTLVEIYLDPEHLDRVKPVLSAVFGKFRAEHFGRSGAGQQRRTILFENRIGPTYLRAVAKIAFHGALKLRPELIGNEWQFDVLRRFIRHGDLPMMNPVQYRNDRIVAGLGDGVMLKDWGHVVAVETTETTVFTKLQLFIGPGAIPPIWVVRIGRRPDHAPANTGVAYYARYLEVPSPDGHTGEMIPLDAAPRA